MNNIIIVTTTINTPTKATLEFINKGYPVIVVGDLKTPHNEYENLENVIYLHPQYQAEHYKSLSDSIGWNTIQRRNIGFVEAYKRGYDIIASVDDDNIPYENWGKNILVNKEIEVDLYDTSDDVFDPLSCTNNNQLWHRGYPIELVPKRNHIYMGKTKIIPMVQSDLWDGDPDIDSICRLSHRPIVKFRNISPYTSNKLMPFNSQNTFIHRSILPYYMMLPFIGRMDDIWGAYILQRLTQCKIVFNEPTVYQERNKQCLVTNLEKEIIGYRHTGNLLKDISNWRNYLPAETLKSYKIYVETMINKEI
jgi:hypothetical protein